MPYASFDAGMYGAPPALPIVDEDEEEKRRLAQAPVPGRPLQIPAADVAPVPVVPPLSAQSIKAAANEQGGPQVMREQPLALPVGRPDVSGSPVAPISEITPDRGALTAGAPTPAPAAPMVRRPPIVADVGQMPDRADPRYAYQGHGVGGRLKAGWDNVRYGGPIQTHGGGMPGEGAGEALGGLLGRFLGGVATPEAGGQAKYARDLGLWQQRSEIANKAANEEAQRAHLIAQSTHRDPYTGEVDPYVQAGIDQKAAMGAAATKRADAASLNAQTAIGRLKETSRQHVLRALESGTFAPTPEEQAELAQAGFRYVGGSKPGQLGMLHQRGVDPDTGRVMDRYFVWDKKTGSIRPATAGGEMVEGGGLLPPAATGGGAAPAQETGLGRPGQGQPFQLEVPAAKGAGPLGDFASPQQALSRLAGHRSAFENAYKAWQREKDESNALAKEEKRVAKQSTVDYSPERSSQEKRLQQLAAAKLAQQAKVDKAEDVLSKIENEVHSKYDELGGGDFIKFRPGEHAGWEHKPETLQVGRPTGYPLGDETHRTGRIRGYHPLNLGRPK